MRWRLRRLFLEDGILVSQPSPRGEGAPQGRIGQTWYERQMVVKEKEGRICTANESTLSTADAVPLPHAGKAYMAAASPRSMAQVAAVLAFVISHTTFLAAQDDETGRCPKVCGQQVSPRGVPSLDWE